MGTLFILSTLMRSVQMIPIILWQPLYTARHFLLWLAETILSARSSTPKKVSTLAYVSLKIFWSGDHDFISRN